MLKRSVIIAVVVAAAGITGSAQAHCEVSGGTYMEAHATFDDVTVEMVESILAGTCDGTPQQLPGEQRLTIAVDGVVVCDRTDVDPSFDPFFFGAGIHNDPDDACGADLTWVSLTDFPTTPHVASNGHGGGYVGLRKTSPIEDGSVWYGDTTLTLLFDAAAYQIRSGTADTDF